MDLNIEQKKAVTSSSRCILIIAGPGTGKTKTLVSRIRYLLEQQLISPSSILALTFTQKAAAEMKDRLSELFDAPYISTFHSLAMNLLKKTGKDIHMISENERKSLLSQIQEKRKKQYSVRELSLLITKYKNNIVSGEMPAVVSEYNKLLQERNVYDYDDLLLELDELLKTSDMKLNQFEHILVDEFQDTNLLQYQILKKLVKNENIFVIGDPYQSIYGFRGADDNMFDLLKKDYPKHTEIVFTTNYRSFPRIIEVSTNLFPGEIELNSAQKGTGEVVLLHTINEFTEAEWIVNTINTKVGGTDLLKAGAITETDNRTTNFSDFAIMYRTHAFSRVLEHKLAYSGIPYQIIGGDSPFEKIEVSFIIAMLQYAVSMNISAFEKILMSPIMGLQKTSVNRLQKKTGKGEKLDLRKLYQDIPQILVSKKDIQKVCTLIQFLQSLDIEVKNEELLKLIHKILEFKYMQEYLDGKQINRKHIHAFMSSIHQFYSQKHSLEKCVQYLDYLYEHEFYDPRADKVTLLTMHAAKGLEFKYVFICGFEEENIPFNKNNNVDEEARLLYVGMTRAKEGLYLLYANERNKKKTRISSFNALLKAASITEGEDEAIVIREKKIKKWKEKKSQLQLF